MILPAGRRQSAVLSPVMRIPVALLLVPALLVLPTLSYAQDAGEPDAGELDAGPTDASAPDASDDGLTHERCLDGYDRSYVEACADKQPGAACTFPGGEAGQCAALRCLDEGARAICVTTRGQPAPPPDLGDAGSVDAGAVSGAEPEAEGGGCGVSPGGSSGLGLVALALLWRRRATARSR